MQSMNADGGGVGERERERERESAAPFEMVRASLRENCAFSESSHVLAVSYNQVNFFKIKS